MSDTKSKTNLNAANVSPSSVAGKSANTKPSVRTKPSVKKNNQPKKVACPICGNKYVGQATVDRHQKTAHSEEKPFECVACPLQYKLNEYYRKHFMAVHIKFLPNKWYRCLPCHKLFMDYDALKNHVYSVHCPNLESPQKVTQKPSKSQKCLKRKAPATKKSGLDLTQKPSTSQAAPVNESPPDVLATVGYATELPANSQVHLTPVEGPLPTILMSVGLCEGQGEPIAVPICTNCKEYEPPLPDLRVLTRAIQSDGTIRTINNGVRCQKCLQSPELPEVVERPRYVVLQAEIEP